MFVIIVDTANAAKTYQVIMKEGKMKKQTEPLKSRSRKMSKSEEEKLMANMTEAIRAALSLESNPGTLSTNVKKCPNCSFFLKTGSSCDICENCGSSKCG